MNFVFNVYTQEFDRVQVSGSTTDEIRMSYSDAVGSVGAFTMREWQTDINKREIYSPTYALRHGIDGLPRLDKVMKKVSSS